MNLTIYGTTYRARTEADVIRLVRALHAAGMLHLFCLLGLMFWFYCGLLGLFVAAAINDGGSLESVIPAALVAGAAVYELMSQRRKGNE